MTVLKSLVLAFACFSRIPMPRVEWGEASMRYMMAFFPLVGVVVGALVALWCFLCNAVGFGQVIRAIGIAIVPVAVTGAIHLDGFADVVDALSSHAEPARKREILKDPHVGAFAIVGICSYLLVYVGFASELPDSWQLVAQLALVHVTVRCESGMATLLFSGAEEGMLASFRTAGDMRSVAAIGVVFGFAAVALVALSTVTGASALVVALACFAALMPFARRSFGGMSGDVAGFFLQVCELAMLACIVVSAKAVGM